jgi:aminoglycoside 6'-N-acetyltransferase
LRIVNGEIAREGDIVIRLASEDDAELLRGWISDQRVAAHYGGRDRMPAEAERITSSFADDEVTRCIVEVDGRPIGYVQFYPVLDSAEFALDAARGVWGMDQFIGIPELWGQGIGSRFVRIVALYLKANGAAHVVTDPAVSNLRAVRAYEKAGFVRVKLLPRHEVHEGELLDNLLMGFQD